MSPAGTRTPDLLPPGTALASPTPGPAIRPLIEPADGVPLIVDTPGALGRTVAAFAAASGPVAADAERASGYRFGQRAYLIQVRRAGAGTALIDPIALPDLSPLAGAVGDAEWVLHAASQDLACMAAVGLRPARLFDTELAARLLGMGRVGLAHVVAEVLGLGLAKEHSAADWSTRPLPGEWLRYAALDVEVLLELRAELGARLEAAGKATWAAQEFEATRTAPPAEPRVDAWRRVSGSHAVRDPRRLAVMRALWMERNHLAESRDIAPGRLLKDSAIVAASRELPRTVRQLVELPDFTGRGARRYAGVWLSAINAALALPPDQLPGMRPPGPEAIPPPRAWAEKNPDAFARWAAGRPVVRQIAAQLGMPAENLLQPHALRSLCWDPPTGPRIRPQAGASAPDATGHKAPTPATVAAGARRAVGHTPGPSEAQLAADATAIGAFLAAHGARPWQVEQLAAPLAVAFAHADQARAARPDPLASSQVLRRFG